MKTEVKNVLKSWRSSLERYGKLDAWNLNESFSILGNYLRSHDDNRNVMNKVRQIRDSAICPSYNADSLKSCIDEVLEMVMPKATVNVCMVTKKKNGRILLEGQSVRFKAETHRIFGERLKFRDGMLLRNFDIETENANDSRKVRRIVEKRMCQAYHRQNKGLCKDEQSNNDRYWMHRATSYQLHNIGQVEHVKNVSRGLSTHYKKEYDPLTGEIVFKKKMTYQTREEALEAIKTWNITHPDDSGNMQAYQCSKCHKWHIGHKVQSIELKVVEV